MPFSPSEDSDVESSLSGRTGPRGESGFYREPHPNTASETRISLAIPAYVEMSRPGWMSNTPVGSAFE